MITTIIFYNLAINFLMEIICIDFHVIIHIIHLQIFQIFHFPKANNSKTDVVCVTKYAIKDETFILKFIFG